MDTALPCDVPSRYSVELRPLKVAAAKCQLPLVTVDELVISVGTCAPSAPSVTTPHTSLPVALTHKLRSLDVAPLSNCAFETLRIVPVAPVPASNQASSVKLLGDVYDVVDSNHPLRP